MQRISEVIETLLSLRAEAAVHTGAAKPTEGFAKPDPRVFRLAAKRAGATLDGAWALRTRAGPRLQAVPAWPARLIVVQIALLYFGSGFWKLVNPYWHQGEMLRMTLAGPWGTGPAAALVALDLPVGFGGQVLASTRLDRRALLIISVSLALGLGVAQVPEFLAHMPAALRNVLESGVATGRALMS